MRILLKAAAMARRRVAAVVSPGPGEPIAGTLTNGYFGEVDQEDLISHSDLFDRTNTEMLGAYETSASNKWLKFAVEGKILYVSKTTLRRNLSWNDLNSRGLIDGSFSTFIGSNKFVIRLLTGSTIVSQGQLIGGEWDDTIKKVLATPNGTGDYASYQPNELGFGSSVTATYSICADTHPTNVAYTVVRGGGNGVVLLNDLKSAAASNRGWRPVLEWVPPDEFAYEPDYSGYESPDLGTFGSFSGSVEDQFYLPKDVDYTADMMFSVQGLSGSVSDQFYLNKDIDYVAEQQVPVYNLGFSFQ